MVIIIVNANDAFPHKSVQFQYIPQLFSISWTWILVQSKKNIVIFLDSFYNRQKWNHPKAVQVFRCNFLHSFLCWMLGNFNEIPSHQSQRRYNFHWKANISIVTSAVFDFVFRFINGSSLFTTKCTKFSFLSSTSSFHQSL